MEAESIPNEGGYKQQAGPQQQPVLDAVGAQLRMTFDQAAAERRLYEDQWLKDLRQYKGIYEAETKKNMDPNRSNSFVRLTRTKVRTMDARVADMLFPKGGDKNWSIKPTPVPELSPFQKKLIIRQLEQAAQMGESVEVPQDEKALDQLVERKAKEICEKMSREMDDQLTECKFEDDARKTIHQGHVIGTGCLKGPMVEESVSQRWIAGEEGAHQLQKTTKRKPYYEFTSIWDIYPDLGAKRFEDCEYIFQRHVFGRGDLRKLARRSDFNADTIYEYIKTHPQGDATRRYHEQEIRNINGKEDAVLEFVRKYEVLEYWGYMDAEDLRQCGCDIPEDSDNVEFEANVWVLGSQVIKAVLNPTEQDARPYHFYVFEEDDVGLFGVSIPSILFDTQVLFNAAIRMMVDNAAISAGPQIEANMGLLDTREDPTVIFPFKVWVRNQRGGEAASPAIRVHTLPSYTTELMRMAQLFKELGDEASTIPSYLHGEQDKGVGRTVGGLSMLMGAANITVKDVVTNFDNGITEPAITALYHWNMQFGEDESIKGDYKVEAQGSTTLVAKEIQSQRLSEYAATIGPADEPWIDRGKLNRHRVSAMEMPKEIVRTEEEYNELAMMQEQIQRLAALLQEAGINPQTGELMHAA